MNFIIIYFQAWFIYIDLDTKWPLLALQSNNKYVFSDRSDAPIVDGHIWWLLNGVRSKWGHLQSWLYIYWRFDICRFIQSLRYIRMCFVSSSELLQGQLRYPQTVTRFNSVGSSTVCRSSSVIGKSLRKIIAITSDLRINSWQIREIPEIIWIDTYF